VSVSGGTKRARAMTGAGSLREEAWHRARESFILVGPIGTRAKCGLGARGRGSASRRESDGGKAIRGECPLQTISRVSLTSIASQI
jgi:hypothetical protein